MNLTTISEHFRDAMRRTASSVAILTTDGEAGRAGVTISTLCSVSLDPPSVIACIHRQSRALPVILTNGVFTANMLAEGQQQVAQAFAGQVEAFRDDRFACADWSSLSTGAPVLAGALASFDCRVATQIEFGSHLILIGEVVDIVTRDAAPLIYTDHSFRKLRAA